MQYIKKSIAIDAIQLLPTRERILIIEQFITGNYSAIIPDGKFDEYVDRLITEGGRIIYTLEGNMKANFGDYIIKGIKNEFYPCREDICLASYSLVTDGSI